MRGGPETPGVGKAPAGVDEALETVGAMVEKYGLTALEDFLASCRRFAGEELVSVVVLGRFKAGKSTFLNHVLGRQLLPVGVIPVTSVVTEVEYGPEERAEVRYRGGRREWISLEQVGSFVNESGNPRNGKGVDRVRVYLPEMRRYGGLRFVDTPGLESVFEHNTAASLEWLPNAGLALVAVGVDPPLSAHDVELIRELGRFTPEIALLLTKVDVVSDGERKQVEEFIHKQLERYWDGGLAVYPYSVKPGYEELRAKLERDLLERVSQGGGEQRAAILRHKVGSLVEECIEYLTVALQAAERADGEREELRRQVLGQKELLHDVKLGQELAVKHAMGAVRAVLEAAARVEEPEVARRLLEELDSDYGGWRRSLAAAMDEFERWLERALEREMSAISKERRGEFAEPVKRVSRQLSQSLQEFRNRLSEKMLEELGVTMKTVEVEIEASPPRAADVKAGKIFDRNWELLS